MSKSRIYFASARADEFDYNHSFVAKYEEILDKIDLSRFFKKKDYVAIKTHFGSYGAHRIIRPIFIRKVVEKIKEHGANPFVTDTVRIPGLEYLEVANMEGLNHLSVGAPVVLADGVFGRDQTTVEAGEVLGSIGVASALYNAPSMIVISHCKGHIASGYGGAIKNLGMGAISCRNECGHAERGRIHFAQNISLEWDQKKCTYCERCIEVCPHEAIYKSEKTEKIEINYEACVKCGRCARVCKEKALTVPQSEERFQKGLSEAAGAAIKTFEKGKILYINFILEVQPECDCMPMADTPVVQDQGVLVSDDIVAIEQATLDILTNAPLLPESKGYDKKVKKEDEPLAKINNKHPQWHIDYAEELGMGQKSYEIIKIDYKQKKEDKKKE